VSVLVEGERTFNLSRREGWDAFVAAPPRQQPRSLDLAAGRALRRKERLAYREERSVWHANLGPIRTPQMLQVIDGLAEIVAANRHDGDRVRSSAAIDALSGLGKTTIALQFAKEFHREQLALYGPVSAAGHDRIPVVYLRLAGRTTLRSLNQAVCEFYGLPRAHRGNAKELGSRAADCALSCGTRLFVVDDVHFLDPSRLDGRVVANQFKHLANEFQGTWLFVGVGLRERGLLSEGRSAAEGALAQTARRWTHLSVDPFQITTEEGRQWWRQLLLTVERQLVLAEKDLGMLADHLAGYLFARSTGHFESLMTLITRGCARAITTGQERLTRELLDQVRNDSAAEHARRELQAAIDRGTLKPYPDARQIAA